VLGTPETIDKLRQTQIPIAGGRFIRVADVAEVGDGSSEIAGFARLDGRPVVGFQLMKTRDSSDIAVEDHAAKAIKQLEKDYPHLKQTMLTAMSNVTTSRLLDLRYLSLEPGSEGAATAPDPAFPILDEPAFNEL